MLPALSHLSALLTRNSNSPQLDTLAASLDWPRGTHKVGALATLAYLVETNTVLWKLPGQFEVLDLSVVRKIIKSFHH